MYDGPASYIGIFRYIFPLTQMKCDKIKGYYNYLPVTGMSSTRDITCFTSRIRIFETSS